MSFQSLSIRFFSRTSTFLCKTKWAPSLADFFLYVYDADFIWSLMDVGHEQWKWFQVVKLKSSLWKLNGRHHHGYVTFVVMTIPSSFMTYHWIFNTSNTTAVSSKAGTDYPSWTTEFKHVFSRVPISH
jgi:hypothetical protein